MSKGRAREGISKNAFLQTHLINIILLSNASASNSNLAAVH